MKRQRKRIKDAKVVSFVRKYDRMVLKRHFSRMEPLEDVGGSWRKLEDVEGCRRTLEDVGGVSVQVALLARVERANRELG